MRKNRRFAGLVALAAALLLMSGLLSGSMSRVAAHGEVAPHPAHVHAGTCDTLGEVVFPLTDVAMADDSGTPVAHDADEDSHEGEDEAHEGDDESTEESEEMDHSGDMDASPEAEHDMGKPAGTSETTVEADLATILGAEHSINVHESAENIQNYIACGEITGTPEDGELVIELAEMNDSGYDGEATLTDNGDGTTTIEIELYDYHEDEESGASADGGVSANIENFAYSPDPIEISVGTTVTWTNLDTAPHTVSQVGGGFESGRMDQGATFSFTFTEPGTYEYFCQFHPNMKGTVVVS
jgi:plastocyanin